MIEQASDLENPEDVVFCFRMGRTEMGMLEESNDPGRGDLIALVEERRSL